DKTIKKAEFQRERFRFVKAPDRYADWLWIQHLLASAKPSTGRIAVVIDNGALFRSGREKAIRKGVLENDLLEAVLLLPEKLFYNTGAPGAILVFRKNKPKERQGKVLFINASQEFESHPTIRKLNRLGDAHIQKIVKAYKDFREEEGFSRVVTLEEIRENDYNLNVTLYVYPIEEEEEIDIPAEWKAIREINQVLKEVEEKLRSFLEELEYDVE
ncbi:MAG: SAM-dependent DNA methyltransferase, partial [Candidatus Hydrothermota bacterium]